jgi:hypothetical protein
VTASEISGYVQIVLGLVGIALTITNIRKLVPDIELFAGQKELRRGWIMLRAFFGFFYYSAY